MKNNKIIKHMIMFVVIAMTVCSINNQSIVFATELENKEVSDIPQANNATKTNMTFESLIKDSIVLNRTITMHEEGEYTIKEDEVIYTLKTKDGSLQPKVYNAYKTEMYTRQFSVSKKGKLLFSVVLDATFRYNGKNAYTEDPMVFTTVYNGASFKGKKTYTKTSQKETTANLTLTGTLSGKQNGKNYSDKFIFKITCTKN